MDINLRSLLALELEQLKLDRQRVLEHARTRAIFRVFIELELKYEMSTKTTPAIICNTVHVH